MWLNDDTQKKYPRCTSFIRSLQDKLKNAPKIREAFHRACKASMQRNPVKTHAEKFAKQALTWDAGPQIVVHKGLINHPGGQACGLHRFIQGFVDHLEITSIWWNAYENCIYEGDRIKNEKRLECTLLHELVHWVRQQAGASELIFLDDDLPGHEAGNQFEAWAYDGVNCKMEELLDAAASYM